MAKNIFVTSDLWINRPVGKLSDKSTNEYNDILINSWNKTVKSKDLVYVLGGVGISDIYSVIVRLNGTIHFLNNFYTPDEIMFMDVLMESSKYSVDKNIRNKFVFDDRQIITLPDEDVVLSYFPLVNWCGKDGGTMCIHGFDDYMDFDERIISCNMNEHNMKPLNITTCKSNIEDFEKNIL